MLFKNKLNIIKDAQKKQKEDDIRSGKIEDDNISKEKILRPSPNFLEIKHQSENTVKKTKK